MRIPPFLALSVFAIFKTCRAAGRPGGHEWQRELQEGEGNEYPRVASTTMTTSIPAYSNYRVEEGYNPYGGYAYGWNQDAAQSSPYPYPYPYEAGQPGEYSHGGNHPAAINTQPSHPSNNDRSRYNSLYRNGVAVESTPRVRRTGSRSGGGEGGSGDRQRPSRPPIPNDSLGAALADFRKMNLRDEPIDYALPPAMRQSGFTRGASSSSSSSSASSSSGRQRGGQQNYELPPSESQEEGDEDSADNVARVALTHEFEEEWERQNIDKESDPKELAFKVAEMTLSLGHAEMIKTLALSKVEARLGRRDLTNYTKDINNCLIAIDHFTRKHGQQVTDVREALTLYSQLRQSSRNSRRSR